MNKRYNRYYMDFIAVMAFVSLAMLMSSCGKNDGATVASGNVIVINEGNFRHPTSSSISVYDPNTKTIVGDVYSNTNGGALLGDVAQSLFLIHDTAYIVMNNSHKIVVADAKNNFRHIAIINLPSSASPRFFLPVNDHKAYVTELYNNKIWIVDYRRDTVTGSIPVRGWTEQLVSAMGKVYVAEMTMPLGTDTVHKILEIDPVSDQVVYSFDLATDASSMALTDQNKLYVLTSSQTNPVIPASLYVVDLSTFSKDRKIDFGPSHSPSRIRFSTYSRQCLYSDNGIYKMSQTDTVLPANAFIASGSWNVYGLNEDPSNGDIYIADALDYQQASHILRYSRDGALIDEFRAGIITNGFAFR